MNWSYLWSRLRAIPAGFYAAGSVAIALLVMYLRGRRLEADLAHARLLTQAAQAAATSAATESAAKVHLAEASKHSAKATSLQRRVMDLNKVSETERKRLAALPASKVNEEFLKLARSKKHGN